MSPATNDARSPRAEHASRKASASRPSSTTDAPSATRTSAVARPRPRAPPPTTNERPARSRSTSGSARLGQLQRGLQLALRERALEPVDDLAVLVDRERPRLGRQVVSEHLGPEALALGARAVEAALADL